MREVERTRFVDAPPAAVERALSPAEIVGYEGSFRLVDVTDADDGTVVTVAGGGLTFDVRFHPRENGYDYRQENGPLETLETTLTYHPENQGTRVTVRSRVSMGYPLSSLTDRFAAWKRRGELRRLLDALARDVE